MGDLWDEKAAGEGKVEAKPRGEKAELPEAPPRPEIPKPSPPADRTLEIIQAQLAGVRDGIISSVTDLLNKHVEQEEARFRELEDRIAKLQAPPPAPQPAPPSEEEVLMGEEGRTSRMASHAAGEVADALRSQGWSADDISKLLQGLGPFLQGIAALRSSGGGPSPENHPFYEAGKAMFTTFAEAMTKGVARVLGTSAAREAMAKRTEEEEEEHEPLW
jgi:hypothetical protein